MADIVLINPRFEPSYWGLEHALPVLGASSVLTDADLIELVRTGTVAKQTAIAGRPEVSAEVAVVLVEFHRLVVRVMAGERRQHLPEHRGVGFTQVKRMCPVAPRHDRVPVRIGARLRAAAVVPLRRDQSEPALILLRFGSDEQFLGQEL